MELYIQDDNFLNVRPIDRFTSLIWTERYSDAGDFSLVVPATPDSISSLAIDTKLGLLDSEETMLIDQQSIANHQLTVTGKSLVNFFGNRPYKAALLQGTTGITVSVPPAVAIIQVVESATTLVDTDHDGVPDTYIGVSSFGLRAEDQIANLGCINLDPDVIPQSIALSDGDVFSQIQTLASNFARGIRLRAAARTTSGHTLIFTVYVGSDRTSDQTDNPVVRFSPGNKSLVNTTELYSNQNFKNICYTYASSMPDKITITDPITMATTDEAINPRMGMGYLLGADTATDFDRRVVMVDDTNFNITNYAAEMADGTSIATIEALIATELDIAAFNFLLNYTYTKTVDGEVIPQSPYTYGNDYFLGDIIELQGASGLIQNARVTEYIRSQDSTGEKSYPTVAVIP